MQTLTLISDMALPITRVAVAIIGIWAVSSGFNSENYSKASFGILLFILMSVDKLADKLTN